MVVKKDASLYTTDPSMDTINSRKEFPQLSCSEEKPSPEKEKFSKLLSEDKEEEKEEEPLLDGPCTTPFVLPTPSGKSAIKLYPSWAIEIITSIVEPTQMLVEKGTSQIEVTIDSKELSLVRITINYYSTAPHSFNIQLEGSEVAQKLFQKHHQSLERLLKITLPNFECRLLPPTFFSKHSSKEEKRKKGLVNSEDLGYLPEMEA